jgi:tetratricopeptide (TPR) repeat protein
MDNKVMDEREKGILLRCARIYFHTKNWPKAISEYQNIAQLFPDDPNVQEQLGLCYKGAQNIPEARKHLEVALRLEESMNRPDKAERLKLKLAELG